MYTIEGLKGKYVKVGTPEAEVFLYACEKLGVRWINGAYARGYTPLGGDIFVNNRGELSGSLCSQFKLAKEFTPKQEWSIYTNDKPLCELSDEQAAALFNAWRGGERVIYQRIGNDYEDVSVPCWTDSVVYRIKQKSERELFIDSAMQLMTSETERTIEQQFGALFDSGKFKLVKDGE